jgi:hypothetical protein
MNPLERMLADPVAARRLYLGISAGLGLLFLLLLVSPLTDLLLEQRAAIQAAELQRQAQGTLAGRVERLLAEQAALATLDGLPADYLPGDSPDLAAASLQALLGQRLAAVGGRLIGTGLVEPADLPEGAGDEQRITARLDAAVSHAQLRDLLHGLEGGQPRLIVVGMRLAAGGEAGAPLSLTLTVSGMRKPVPGGAE